MSLIRKFPASFVDGCLTISQGESGDRVVTMGGAPVRELVPGWHCNAAYDIAGVVFVLDFENGESNRGEWWLDPSFNFIGNNVDLLPLELIRQLASDWAPAFDEIGASVGRRPDGGATRVADLLVLSPFIRLRLLAAIDRCREETVRLIELYAADRPLDIDEAFLAGVERVISEPFDRFQARVIARGAYEIICPIAGVPLVSKKSILVHEFFFCVPFETVTGERYFIVLSRHKMAPVGAYFPVRRLLVTNDATVNLWLVGALRAHAAEMCEDLLAYLGRRRKTLLVDVLRETHIGHSLWDEQSGIYQLIQSGASNKVARLAVISHDGSEMYGPLDELFPEFAGRVVRVPRSIKETALECYRNNWFAVRLANLQVQQGLAQRIIDRIAGISRDDLLVRGAAAAKAEGTRVILFGLRVENRTWVRLREGYVRLLRALGLVPGHFIVLIDGHNTIGPGSDRFMRSTRETGREIVDAEFAMVRELVRENPGNVSLLSMVGMPLARNLALIGEAEFFVAPWGAGLAKYKWIWNKPGIVFTNKRYLQKAVDIQIYDDPDYREGAIPCDFLAPEFITDLPESQPLLKFREEWLYNFDLDEAELERLFLAYLAHPNQMITKFSVSGSATPTESVRRSPC